MPNIFEDTRRRREQEAGLQDKPKQEPKKKQEKTMSQAEFSGYDRPKPSKKWIEK